MRDNLVAVERAANISAYLRKFAELIRTEVKAAAKTKAQGLDKKFAWAAGAAALAVIGAAAAAEDGGTRCCLTLISSPVKTNTTRIKVELLH